MLRREKVAFWLIAPTSACRRFSCTAIKNSAVTSWGIVTEAVPFADKLAAIKWGCCQSRGRSGSRQWLGSLIFFLGDRDNR